LDGLVKNNRQKSGFKGQKQRVKIYQNFVKKSLYGKKREKLLTFIKYLLYNKLSQGERGKYHASDISA